MIKWFKNIRRKSIAGNRLGKYLLYACGEIILITVGVLLAIQANNFNETRKTAKKTADVYSRVYSDIDRNLQDAETFLGEYREMEYLYERVLNDSIDKKLLNEGLSQMVTGVILLEYDRVGIEQLKTLNLRDDKSIELIEIYESGNLHFKAYAEALEKNVENNFIYWRDNTSWFQTYASGGIDEAAAEYFVNSQDYKNRVSYFYLLLYQGYIPSVETFVLKLKKWKEEYPEA